MVSIDFFELGWLQDVVIDEATTEEGAIDTPSCITVSVPHAMAAW